MSNLSAFPYIPERAEAVPALWNNIFSILSANDAALNSAQTISFPSGNTLSVFSSLDASGNLHAGNRIGVGLVPSADTVEVMTIGADSSKSDYILFHDPTGAKSSYIIGSRVGGTADGLNIYDASGSTMIASFSKQSIRFFQNVVGPVFDVGGALADTLNAATFGTGADSKESRIQAAISAASIAHISRVYVPASMYPYSAGSVSFATTVQMVREGGRWDVYDVRAYGADPTGVLDATAAIKAIRDTLNPSANGGTILFPAGTYKTTSIVNQIGNRIAFVADAPGASVVLKSHDSDCFRIASGSNDVTFLNMTIDGGSTFSGRGIFVDDPFGVRFAFIGGSITSTKESCIEFIGDGGERSTIADCAFSTISSNGSCPAAIRKAARPTKALPMVWSRIQTAPFVPLFSGIGLYGASISDCYFSGMETGFDFDSQNTNVRFHGNRVGNVSTLTIRGAAIVCSGNVFNAGVSLETTFVGSSFVGNQMDPAFVFTDNTVIGTNMVIEPPIRTGTMKTPMVVSIGTIQPHSTASTLFISNGTIAASRYSSTMPASSFAVELWLSNQNALRTGVAGGSYFMDLGFLVVRDGNSSSVNNGGIWTNSGTAALPSYAFASETTLGLYRSGVDTIAQSQGTFNLATNSVRLSMRTIAASALTASAANTNVAVNEVVFTIQASGASFAINSGGTTWLFNSDASAKNT